jgi:hypothetical protein
MDLARKFYEEATCDLIAIDKLKVQVKHQILRAERVYTRYGPCIMLTIRGLESRRYKAYLPRRYSGLITEAEITAINDRHIVLNHLTTNCHFSGRTAPLTSRRCILYIYSTNIYTDYFKHAAHSLFFLFKIPFIS